MLWSLHNVTLTGRGRPRLEEVSVEIPTGRVAIVGASGSGKTSLLNLLVGYEEAEGLEVSGERLASTPRTRDQGQGTNAPFHFWSPPDFGLWPHLTVHEHLDAVSPTGDHERIERLLTGFGLDELAKAFPNRLSQGEASRLSVARAVAAQPRVLVLDEPLEHVDTALRDQCWKVLRDEVASTGASLVFSTHSPERVLSEADWCLCLDAGKLVWSGSVEELYERPASPEMARFLGACNWVGEEAGLEVRGEGLVTEGYEFKSSEQERMSPVQKPIGMSPPAFVPPCLPAELSSSDNNQLAGPKGPGLRPVRPERLRVVADDEGPYSVTTERFSGSLAEVELTHLVTGQTERVYHRPPRPSLQPGQRVSLRILAIIMAALVTLGQGGCDAVLGVPALQVVSSDVVRIPVDGARMPAPRALTISPEKELYVLDDSGRILVYDNTNKLVRQWRMPESSVGKPEGIRILQDGRVAIADTHYHQVVFFSKQGVLLSKFGTKGEKPGEFTYPVDLLQDPKGFLYVAEYGGSDRIQKFAPDGKFVLEFGGLGTETGKFQRPSGMVWIDSKLYVADAINCRVQVFSDEGQPLDVLDWAGQGGLYYPYDMALGPDGLFYLVEYGACRVTVAEPQGKLVAQYGHEGRGFEELWTPWALTVAEDGRVFIADTGNRRIVQLTLAGGRP